MSSLNSRTSIARRAQAALPGVQRGGAKSLRRHKRFQATRYLIGFWTCWAKFGIPVHHSSPVQSDAFLDFVIQEPFLDNKMFLNRSL